LTLDRYGACSRATIGSCATASTTMFADASEGQVLALDRTASGPTVVPDSG